jgi:hypothetical protein
MTEITKEMIEAAKSAYWHEVHNGGGYSDKCYEAAIRAALSSRSAEAGKPVVDVDALAQEIRRVDGNHSLGAGALAEALMPFLSALSTPADIEPVVARWLVEETLPSGSIMWEVVEHEQHARTIASRNPENVTVTPLYRSAPVADIEPVSVPDGWVLVQQAALDWLFGEGPDPAGFHFGDWPEDVPRPKGEFWWRSVFRQILAHAPASPSIVAPVGVPDGWHLVPKEPNREMCLAARAESASQFYAEDAQSPVVVYRAMLAAAPHPTKAEAASVPEWHDGAPPKPWADEWFIAETTYGERVVLTSLPKEWSYDFKTADETYIKADKIKRWMQFPDSRFIAPDAPHPTKTEAVDADALIEPQKTWGEWERKQQTTEGK